MLFFNKVKINEAVEEFRNTPDAVLLDVREPDEFKEGHIPGAVNLPMSKLNTIDIPEDKALYVYCLSGATRSRAVRVLKERGYENVKSIGGISSYKGQLEK